MVKSIDKDSAKDMFLKMVDKINNDPTTLKEYIQKPLTYRKNVLEILSNEKKGTIIWQHTDRVHVACMYLKRGSGFIYSRGGIDLYNLFEKNGIDMTDEDEVGKYFDVAWDKSNPNSDVGIFPKIKSSLTNYERSKLESYIVNNEYMGENLDSELDTNREQNNLDRTHLIPVTVTGIENNKAVLIMFDSYLNQVPLKNFENKILQLNEDQDLIWWCVITKKEDTDFLEWYYVILDTDGKVIDSFHVTDDRWYYDWYYDDRYQKIEW